MQGDVTGADPVACRVRLDDAWREAFRLAWEAVTTGNIGVGAVRTDGPRRDELGAFATLLSRLGPGLIDHIADELRAHGEGPVINLAREVDADGTLDGLRTATVEEAFVHLWPRLQEVTAARWPSVPVR